ncbi:MAG: hypoxanthine-guanine phosphoribosyltransferase [Gammaproteobacteria bacterium]|nr:hypoxanthine-guanine phosphoribosyltransferase [Gammaproteobacteria bacterium]
MSVTPEHIKKVLANADQLYSADEVQKAVDKMAAEISDKLKDSNPLVLCVMVGGLIPAGWLLPRLHFPMNMDYIHATRYRGNTSGGTLHWIAKPSMSLDDRVVLIIDDILDEGITLTEIVKDCRAQGAREVYTAALVEKKHNRNMGDKATFIGLEVEDRYVFGCGMDYKGYLRNLPGIYAVKENE